MSAAATTAQASPPGLEFREAVRQALDEEMARDPRVVFFGEDVAKPGGVFAVTGGLLDRHGPRRVFDTPISELAITGAAFGAAVSGLRPVIEIMFADFLGLSMDSIVNQAAKYWFLSNEQASVPLVVRSSVGAGGNFGAIHSQSPVGWFQNVPGLKIVAPSTPADARDLLVASIRDENPVLFLEHKRLYSTKGPAAEPEPRAAIGEAAIVREGGDVTVVAAMQMVAHCLEAAAGLSGRGVECEVVDVRTLRPLDRETILGSLARTNRLVVVDEGPVSGGWGAEVLAMAAESRLDTIDDVWRIASADAPIPYSRPLEEAFIPSARSIEASIASRLGLPEA